MGLRNTETGWGWPARLLHWALAALVFFMFGLGLWMSNMATATMDEFEQKIALIQLHKSWGFVVFSLALVRVAWRLLNAAPELPAQLGAAERIAAHLGHYALYALLFAMPLSGWLMASASELQEMYGIRNMVFGLFEMPDPFAPGSKSLEDLFRAVHFWCGIALALTVLGHAAAALRHHFVHRDNVLTRMITGR